MRFCEISELSHFKMRRLSEIIDDWRNFENDSFDFVVYAVSADVLAPSGVKPSAGTPKTNFPSYKWAQHLKS